MRKNFWKHIPITELTNEEWEAICDGCGKCCLIKLQEHAKSAPCFSSVACEFLNTESCKCKVYRSRKQKKNDCIILTPQNIRKIKDWLPNTCAYRLVSEKKDLPEINLVDQNQIVGTLMLQTKASTFKPENDIEKNYWFTLNREDISKFTGRNFSQYIIYLNGDYKIPKPRVITAKISNNHKKYAITWFSMAISILLIYLYFRKKNY